MTKSLTVLAVLALLAPARAATLMVGSQAPFHLPSQAARVAKAGDVIRIAPGTYHDCAVWRAARLTIEGQNAVITGKVCSRKALFVIRGRKVTVRGIRFAGAATPDGNGAGIRAEAGGLTIEDCSFVDNQEGLLAGNIPGATIEVRNSNFEGNGACLPDMGCAHGIYVGHIALLRVEHSTFLATKVGHHIKSRALETEIIDNRIEDGPQGTASYLVDLPVGGSLELRGNTMEKGPLSGHFEAAVSIGEEGLQVPVQWLHVIDNVFRDDGYPTVFVRNLTPVAADLSGNVLKGGDVTPLSGKGSVR